MSSKIELEQVSHGPVSMLTMPVGTTVRLKKALENCGKKVVIDKRSFLDATVRLALGVGRIYGNSSSYFFG